MVRYVCAVMISFLLASSGVSAQPEVLLLANTSPPYSDSKLPEQGLALELVNHLMKRAGYRANFKFESWQRALEGVSVGVYDALAAAWYSPERAEEYLYSEPYLSSKLVLLKLRSDPVSYRSINQLAGKRLGHQVDYAYGVDFDSIPGLRLVPENYALQNLLGLVNGSVDLVIGDQRSLAMQIHEFLPNQVQKFQVVSVSLPERTRHVAASREIAGQEKMIDAFNRALAQARKDGSHAAIIAKWDQRYSISKAD